MAGFTINDSTAATGAGWGWIVAYGVVSILLGLFAFAEPLVATMTATVLAAFLFLFAGVVSLIAGLRSHDHHGRGYSVLFGAISIVAGLTILFYPLGGALTLTLLITVWLAVRGVAELTFAFRQRVGRAWMLLLGIVNLGLALYVWSMLPVSALTLPGAVLAISFLLGGVNALVSGLAHRRGAPAFAVPG